MVTQAYIRGSSVRVGDAGYRMRRSLPFTIFGRTSWPCLPPGSASHSSSCTRCPTTAIATSSLTASCARTDRQRKRLLYGRESVPVSWMFDMQRRQVECWHAGDVQGSIEHDTLTLDVAPGTPPLDTGLTTFFRSVLDD